jgi:Flp pilus assembly protein TadD
VNDSSASPCCLAIRNGRPLRSFLATIALLLTLIPSAIAQQGTIKGTVFDATGKPVGGASVRLQGSVRQGKTGGVESLVESTTSPAGGFAFSALPAGSYTLIAEKSGLLSRPTSVVASSGGSPKTVDLVLDADSAAPSSAPAMEFADKPNFTVAGVTDWTAVGGHGSDATLRTSEALARETLTLKSQGAAPDAREAKESESNLRTALAAAPGSFEANHQLGEFYLHAARYREAVPLLQAAYRLAPANRGNEFDLARAYEETGDLPQSRDHVEKLLEQHDEAALHRLLGEVDEKTGDPLAAVHENEQAVRLDPSEQNYFAWGSELLLHRAVWQAGEVFKNGTRAYPQSARMLAALGTALFAGALYDQAAESLCQASDLNPADTEPYIFMGKIELAAPNPSLSPGWRDLCSSSRKTRSPITFTPWPSGNGSKHWTRRLSRR